MPWNAFTPVCSAEQRPHCCMTCMQSVRYTGMRVGITQREACRPEGQIYRGAGHQHLQARQEVPCWPCPAWPHPALPAYPFAPHLLGWWEQLPPSALSSAQPWPGAQGARGAGGCQPATAARYQPATSLRAQSERSTSWCASSTSSWLRVRQPQRTQRVARKGSHPRRSPSARPGAGCWLGGGQVGQVLARLAPGGLPGGEGWGCLTAGLARQGHRPGAVRCEPGGCAPAACCCWLRSGGSCRCGWGGLVAVD